MRCGVKDTAFRRVLSSALRFACAPGVPATLCGMNESAHNHPRAEHTSYAGQIVRGGLLGGLLALALTFAWWLAKILVKREIESSADELDDFLDDFLPPS